MTGSRLGCRRHCFKFPCLETLVFALRRTTLLYFVCINPPQTKHEIECVLITNQVTHLVKCSDEKLPIEAPLQYIETGLENNAY